MTTKHILKIDNLVKTYGSVHAIDGLSLTIEPGTVFGFLGPNGAGKTTTMRILTGLTSPTNGKVWIGGEPVNPHSHASSLVGYLPEEPAFYSWMTPTEILDYVGKLFGLPAAARAKRAAELLDLVDLADVAKRKIGGFSRGMRQRLGLAQALVNQPELLLLDEPVSALDPAGRKTVLDMIGTLSKSCTVFMSTHILDDVQRICDRVGIIKQGKLVADSPIEALLAKYSIPSFALECDPVQTDLFTSWLKTLQSEPWLTQVTQEGPSARLLVDDMTLARSALLPSALASGIDLRRYEILTPTLEDVFLRLTYGTQPKGSDQ